MLANFVVGTITVHAAGRGNLSLWAKGQLSLAFPSGWGGARKGAGRKPGPRPKTAPRLRPAHRGWQPVHVTLRASLRVMRSDRVFGALQRAFRHSLRRAPEQFRVLHFSIQSDHVHLLIEAADKQQLSRGMQSLSISIARTSESAARRRGRFWPDRFHARALGIHARCGMRGLRSRELSKHAAGSIRRAGSLLVGAAVRWCGDAASGAAIARVAAQSFDSRSSWPALELGSREWMAPSRSGFAYEDQRGRLTTPQLLTRRPPARRGTRPHIRRRLRQPLIKCAFAEATSAREFGDPQRTCGP